MTKYKVECVKLQDYPSAKISRGFQAIEAETPKNAMAEFIRIYLDPLESPTLSDRGCADSEDKFISAAIKTQDLATYFLCCKFKGKKTKPVKD